MNKDPLLFYGLLFMLTGFTGILWIKWHKSLKDLDYGAIIEPLAKVNPLVLQSITWGLVGIGLLFLLVGLLL